MPCRTAATTSTAAAAAASRAARSCDPHTDAHGQISTLFSLSSLVALAVGPSGAEDGGERERLHGARQHAAEHEREVGADGGVRPRGAAVERVHGRAHVGVHRCRHTQHRKRPCSDVRGAHTRHQRTKLRQHHRECAHRLLLLLLLLLMPPGPEEQREGADEQQRRGTLDEEVVVERGRAEARAEERDDGAVRRPRDSEAHGDARPRDLDERRQLLSALARERPAQVCRCLAACARLLWLWLRGCQGCGRAEVAQLGRGCGRLALGPARLHRGPALRGCGQAPHAQERLCVEEQHGARRKEDDAPAQTP